VKRRSFEIPTLVVAVVIHGGWLSLTWYAHALPLVALAPLAGLLLAWHGSLQHEAVHGHPTRWRSLNALIGGVPLSLWLPLPIYRESHLAHHRAELTDPIEDPESYYLTAEQWRQAGTAARALHVSMNTLTGRLLLGPIVMVARLFVTEARRLAAGDRRRARVWLLHAAGCAAVLVWVGVVCRLSVGLYLAAFVYPGLALTLLRSYAEHRPDPDGARRSVVVESGPLLSFVYLYNNLHALHHRQPGLPWYELPARWRAQRAEILAENGGYHFDGYGAIARRFAVVPKDSPVHPGGRP
jgi:fatty acid desaturase